MRLQQYAALHALPQIAAFPHKILLGFISGPEAIPRSRVRLLLQMAQPHFEMRQRFFVAVEHGLLKIRQRFIQLALQIAGVAKRGFVFPMRNGNKALRPFQII